MNLRTTIEERYKNAIRAKNNNEINTLRLIKSAIKDKDIASRTTNQKEGINDTEIMSLLQNLIKQRNDSITSFESAGRDDLADTEKKEIEIISQFLPKQKTEEETKLLISNIIKEEKLLNIKDMGKLMSILKSKHSGSLDMGLAGKIAKSKLSN
tara:strand:- start:1298 stop:1759 length:462 start_codon:yes stop_codon:yes gene_type:complete